LISPRQRGSIRARDDILQSLHQQIGCALCQRVLHFLEIVFYQV
jgi:hypothetical protein